MGDKTFTEVVDWNEHIEPYRIIQFISGMNSGKNHWVENTLMNQKKVLLITSRKSKVGETKNRLHLGSSLNFQKLEKDALNYFWSDKREDGSCVCNNWQIEHYMKYKFVADDTSTHLWNFFDVVVIDESHSLATDATYADAPFYLYDFIRATYKYSNIKTVLMTATFSPIKSLIRVKDENNYKIWDFRDKCRNILPKKIDFFEREHILSIITSMYRVNPECKKHIVYFATRTDNIKKIIIPFLTDGGIPEEKIAVSFSRDEAAEGFSDIILKNKQKTEAYMKAHEDLPDDIAVFITTSKNKEGINLANKEFYWDIIIESHWLDEAQQMWGRVRTSANQVVIVHDAPQHVKHSCDKDFDYIFNKDVVKNINASFNEWCIKNDIPLKNRYKNDKAKEKIKSLEKERFPYVRYSICDEKFMIYRGKILGERSFEKSLDCFDIYMDYWQGRINLADSLEPIFPTKMYLYKPYSKKAQFEKYAKERGFLDGKPISKEEQDEMLKYITDELRVRQKGNTQSKYTYLADAVKQLEYTVKECTKDKNRKYYGYRKLVKMQKNGEDFDLAI